LIFAMDGGDDAGVNVGRGGEGGGASIGVQIQPSRRLPDFLLSVNLNKYCALRIE